MIPLLAMVVMVVGAVTPGVVSESQTCKPESKRIEAHCRTIMDPAGGSVELVKKLVDSPIPGISATLHCVKPACRSNPCQNGGTCSESLQGYLCACNGQFFGKTCGCPVVYTPDVGEGYSFTFPGWRIVPEMTSLDFEVSAGYDRSIVLSSVNSRSGNLYVFHIGDKSRNLLAIFKEASSKIAVSGVNASTVLYTGIPSYRRFSISFRGPKTVMGDHGNEGAVVEITDPAPLEVNYAGVRTRLGWNGFWKFHSFCPDN